MSGSTDAALKIGVLLLNFGEPEEPTEAEVVPFLEQIFMLNARLEPGDAGRAVARARQLALDRAPGLIEEYEGIGGSPLNAQARAQAEAVGKALTLRGLDVVTFVGMQFTTPTIEETVASAKAEGVQRIVAVPVYPLCGPSTTVASLEAVSTAVRALGWDVPLLEISGWHAHPHYIRLRADGIIATAAAASLDFAGRARLVFSAHGTPMKYIREGSRYDLYVEHCCREVARAAGVDAYAIGYQNHENRPIEWTQPAIQQVVEGIDADDIVVVPISFMHEQSETLAELDDDLRQLAESHGLGFHRVPIPHDDPRFADVLADLVEARLGREAGADAPALELRACRCRRNDATRCLNASFERTAYHRAER